MDEPRELTDAEKADCLMQEVLRLRRLISLMSEESDQTVVYITFAFESVEKAGIVVTHSDELGEEKLARFIGDRVKTVLDELSVVGGTVTGPDCGPENRKEG